MIGTAIRSVIPALLGVLLAILASVPTGVEHLASVMPGLTLIAVYYWTLQRPELMVPTVAFVLGLWKDILLGGPLGLMAVLLLLSRTFIVNQRQFVAGQPFLVGWMGFILLSAGVAVLSLLGASWWYGEWLGGLPFLIQWGLGVAVYPVLFFIFEFFNRWI